MKPIILDLYCGAGGSARGYQRAGFFVVGIDIVHQKRYIGDDFIRANALDILRRLIYGMPIKSQEYCYKINDFSAIHASPPCQAYSITRWLSKKQHPNLLPQTRDLLVQTQLPYIIENVPGSPIRANLMLCGTMFGLGVIRHRYFECSFPINELSPCCQHDGFSTGNRARRKGVTKTPTLQNSDAKFVTVAGNNYLASEGKKAMGIDWMTKAELSQAIPPAYTEWLGIRLLKEIKKR